MGLRFRKSIKLGKGVKLNLSKKGVGFSVGGKGARFSVGAGGRRTTSLGIPGTGLSYVHTSSSKKKSSSARPSNTTTYTTATVKKPMLTGLVPMILTIAFGWLGLHWFISGRIGIGFLYLFTFGLFGIGWFVDSIRQIIAFVKLLNQAKTQENI